MEHVSIRLRSKKQEVIYATLKKERARLHQGWATHKRLCDTAKGCRNDWLFSYNGAKKMNTPELFTLGELQMICLRAHIPAEDMEAIIKF